MNVSEAWTGPYLLSLSLSAVWQCSSTGEALDSDAGKYPEETEKSSAVAEMGNRLATHMWSHNTISVL